MKVTPASSHPLNVVLRQMADIHPYEGNPRINDEGVQYVANSIKEFGIKQPIVIDKEGTIVAGHTRYAALKKLKWTAEVPCIMADDLSPKQVNAYRLADNKTAEFSDWDLPKLNAEMAMLGDHFEMARFGFLEDEGRGDDVDNSDNPNNYTDAVKYPDYEPEGVKVSVNELVNREFTDKLMAEIAQADISDDEKKFLTEAAQRHLVFDYQKIAEYYVSASPEVQNLMERSALVIIDYDRAVQEGYVKVTAELKQLMGHGEGETPDE